jgi:hypothetical protein
MLHSVNNHSPSWISCQLSTDPANHGLQTGILFAMGVVSYLQHMTARACQEIGVEIVTEEYSGNDPLADVVSWNLRRRHLNDAQRARVAAKMANMNVGRHWKNSNSDHDLNNEVSQAEAGRRMDVSSRSVWMANKIQ